MKKNRLNSLYYGFTLSELVVVMAILAILMLLSYLAAKSQIFKGYDARRKTDLAQIKIALEEYEKDHNCYPLNFHCDIDESDDLKPHYIPTIPCDPTTKDDYIYIPEFTDMDSVCASWYWLFTVLDNDSDRQIEDLGCDYGCGPTTDTTVYNYYVSSPNAPEPEHGAEDVVVTPPATSGTIESGFYGCFDGFCRPISWDPSKPGLECVPGFSSDDCRNLCINPTTGQPQNECL